VNLKDSSKTERQASPAEDAGQTAARATGELKKNQDAYVPGHDTRVERAEARTERAEARTEQAKTRIEQAEMRTEQAETRTEIAKTRTEQAETRTEQVETILRRAVNNEFNVRPEISKGPLKQLPMNGIADQKSPLEQLTNRQREILQLIAEGRNTKQTAEILKVSPKTVEYHRMKLMNCLNVHNVPGLVRFALRVGLISQES
jgi:DNA-binding CsgD family transcriptional regulator